MSNCYWITGLSAAGKTTLSSLLVTHLRESGETVVHLDGDILRRVFSFDAYAREARIINGMRYSKLCKLLSSQGVIVVIAVIGLFKELHEWNRKNIPNYVEIFIDTPISELQNRDPKGLYKGYESGINKNVAGMDLEVDFPLNPDIHLKWYSGRSVDSMFDELLSKSVEYNKFRNKK
jgi:cytidine diphosphoramidate kinase